ncbi:class II aldolase/adducin family protein, partial [Synechococcus sp. AH-601-L23]|nr:class II aldolase/adducin family protein [Synechococcus sp. AH-601-L23]
RAVCTDLNSNIPGILVAGHGLYAWGDSLAETQRHVEILEFLLSAVWHKQLLPPVR